MSLVEEPKVWQLDLYVAGSTTKAKITFENLKHILKDSHQTCHINVIDILLNPKLAIENQIMVNPTTILRYPLPKITLVGNLTNTQQVVAKLGLNKKGDPKNANKSKF
jgi:circadian clock protein KaiB